MGKKLELSRELNAFTQSHANTAIHDFMNGALDVAKNAILSATGQAIFWDENGLRLCKWNSDRTGYEDEQIWMKDNLIVFTEDAWQHAKMAIGHIHDDELGDLWGVIADSIVGKLLAGENLIIMGTDPTGKKTLFRVDGSGMYAYNSRFWMESANGGAFAVDPSFGLGLGQGNPFIVGDDGTIVPKCIDPKTGELKLDKDGFPVGMNLWAGMDGQVYVRGNIYATDGVFNGTVYATDGQFKGIVKATDFQTADGASMLINGKFNSKHLDLGNIQIDGRTGDITMTGDINMSDASKIDLGGIVIDGAKKNINFTGAGSITWGNHGPVKYQFSENANGPWHDTMQTNDKYRRDSLDGGTTWGTPYQFKGTDGTNGRPGSDADVTRNNIAKAMLDAIEADGLYAETINGRPCLLINASAIKSGSITGIDIYGGAFHDLDGIASLTLAKQTEKNKYTDLRYEQDGYLRFGITQDMNSYIMSLNGTTFASSNSYRGTITLSDKVVVHAKFA